MVPQGFTHDVLVRWGDPVVSGAPAFDVRAQTVEAAGKWFGYNNDYVGLVPFTLTGDQTLPHAVFVTPAHSNDSIWFVRSRAINATKNRKVSESPWRLRGVPFPYRLLSNSPRFAPAT
mgnify:CR=1 FL=1